VIATMLVGRDQAHLNQPWVSSRTIRVDSTNVGILEFRITEAETQALYQSGYDAAQTFLSTWDWPAYVQHFRQGMSEPRYASRTGAGTQPGTIIGSKLNRPTERRTRWWR